MIFFKKYQEIWYILDTCINVTNMILTFCQEKPKTIFSQKNTLKGDISGITELDDIHPRKYGISI